MFDPEVIIEYRNRQEEEIEALKAALLVAQYQRDKAQAQLERINRTVNVAGILTYQIEAQNDNPNNPT